LVHFALKRWSWQLFVLFPFGLSPSVFFFLILAFCPFLLKRKETFFLYASWDRFLFPLFHFGSPHPLRRPLPHITPARELENACAVPHDDTPCPCVRIAPSPTKDPRNPVETRLRPGLVWTGFGGGGARAQTGKKWIETTYRISKR
jgi:hypothetical protein